MDDLYVKLVADSTPPIPFLPYMDVEKFEMEIKRHKWKSDFYKQYKRKQVCRIRNKNVMNI